MRVYVPATLARLAAAFRAREVGPGAAYAVTPGQREWYAEADDEELEYAALTQAARASLGLLAAGNRAGSPEVPRRVVLACDVDVAPPGGGELGDAGLTLDAVVPWSSVAAVHVDAAEAATVVEAAVVAWDAAEVGDDDALFAVDACEGEELLWYATQEVPDLLSEMGLLSEVGEQRS
ncbi:MAG TPA: hypothetical protein VEK80_08965 [Kribbellaceae bacterium]|nr:hypothetical protein [Kribbellaceae bacterium]